LPFGDFCCSVDLVGVSEDFPLPFDFPADFRFIGSWSASLPTTVTGSSWLGPVAGRQVSG
jgi:hypothetical protein